MEGGETDAERKTNNVFYCYCNVVDYYTTLYL